MIRKPLPITPLHYPEVRAAALQDWRETREVAEIQLQRLSNLADLIRLSDAVLQEQTPLDVRQLFNAINNLRNKLHRRPKEKKR